MLYVLGNDTYDIHEADDIHEAMRHWLKSFLSSVCQSVAALLFCFSMTTRTQQCAVHVWQPSPKLAISLFR